MSALELKAEIHKKIDALNDLTELLDINLSLNWLVNEQPTEEEKKVLARLSKVEKNSEEGKGFYHDDVMKEAQIWLGK